jgi:methyl coenzyme M reductase subunit D
MCDSNEEVSCWNEAIFWRGLYLQRYSGAEFALTQLLAEARNHPAYQQFGDLPFNLSKKLTQLRKILSVDGPVRQHAVAIGDFLEKIERRDEERNFIVHGILNVKINDEGNKIIRLSMYNHKKGDVYAGRWEIKFDDRDLILEDIKTISDEFLPLSLSAIKSLKG